MGFGKRAFFRSSQELNDNSKGPVIPVLAGISSLIIPGTGQMISGETRRGLTFPFGQQQKNNSNLAEIRCIFASMSI